MTIKNGQRIGIEFLAKRKRKVKLMDEKSKKFIDHCYYDLLRLNNLVMLNLLLTLLHTIALFIYIYYFFYGFNFTPRLQILTDLPKTAIC